MFYNNVYFIYNLILFYLMVNKYHINRGSGPIKNTKGNAHFINYSVLRKKYEVGIHE